MQVGHGYGSAQSVWSWRAGAGDGVLPAATMTWLMMRLRAFRADIQRGDCNWDVLEIFHDLRLA